VLFRSRRINDTFLPLTMKTPWAVLPLLSLLSNVIYGLPYMLISSTRPKCVSVTASQGTTLHVAYYAPDMILPPPDDVEPPLKDSVISGMNVTDGMDAHYKRHITKLHLEDMKRAGHQMRDLSIVIQQVARQNVVAAVANDFRRRREKIAVDRSGGTVKLRMELDTKEGSLSFETGGTNGPVEICLQSLSATVTAPSRVMLNITQQTTGEAEHETETILKEVDRKLEEVQAKARQEVPRFHADLIALEGKVDMMLSNSYFASEQEDSFHVTSIRLNRSTKYWPMIHITVLFIAGFTQANHIVRFFKERHIF